MDTKTIPHTQYVALLQVAAAAAAVRRLHASDGAIKPDAWHNHWHDRPGIWDDDNSQELAGRPCEKCAAMARFNAAIAELEKETE